MPMIKLSDQKDITLEVRVTNLNGDDAYEASVIASFSRSLTYSSFHFLPNVSLASSSTSSRALVPDSGNCSSFLIPEAPGILYS